jgi:hypothetical protein
VNVTCKGKMRKSYTILAWKTAKRKAYTEMGG